MINTLQPVFASLNSHEVRYVVFGGIAAALHGVPRATFDLDLFIEATEDNAEKLLAAFLDARLGNSSLITIDELLSNEITVFKDWVRIDVMTSTPGLSFEQAWKNRVEMKHNGDSFYVISRNDLMVAKKASGPPIDLEDVRILEGDG